jgi:salicylate hydroxylase
MTETTNPTINGQTTLVDNTVSQKNGKGLSNGTVTNNGMSNPAMTFPSQSLRFLEKVETNDVTHYQNGSKAPEPARLKLDVVIVGAGIGGLACAVALARRGHSVRVLEQAPKLGEASLLTQSMLPWLTMIRSARAFTFLLTRDDCCTNGE